MTVPDFTNMSDEEFAKLDENSFAEPTAENLEEGDNQEDDQNQQDPEPQQTENTGVEDGGQSAEGDADADGAEGDGKEGKQPEDDDGDVSDADLDKQEPPAEQKEKAPKQEVEKQPEEKAEKKEEPKQEKEPVKAADQQIDYKAEFEKLVGTPIKANGKEITLKDTNEVLRLVQQGAGYAQKMEQLKPARKLAAMLRNANLMDEAAVGHMIDLYNGDPKAIAKMVKDLKIDIFALDMDSADTYTPNSHLQTDEAVNFQDTLEEVRNLEGGRETLTLIDGMDDKSRSLLWGNARAVRELYDLKQSGVYDTVANEVQRRRTLGQIPADVPFIVAFQQVGEEQGKAAEAANKAREAEQSRTPPVAEPAKPAPRTPVATGAAPRKPQAPNAQAAAAASPRTGIGAAKSVPDIYSLSDDDFAKLQHPPELA